jgi:predicted MFS family arabinose efflux permease
LSIALVRVVVNTAHRMVYPFLPFFAADLGVSLASFSLVLTVRSLLGTASPFLATLVERRGTKAGMLVGLAALAAAMGLVSASPTFAMLVLALLVGSAGKYLFDPAMQAFLGDQVPYHRRGVAIAVTEMSWSLAFLVGVPALSLLKEFSGWRLPFMVLGGLSLLSLAWLARRLPQGAPSAAQANPFRNLRAAIAYGPAVAGLAVSFLFSAANETVNLVFGWWMRDSFDLHIAALGAATAVIGLAEFGGESLVGVLADRMGKQRAIGLGLALNSLAALALPLVGDTLLGAEVGLFFFYLTFEFTIVSTIPLMTELYPPARATLMAGNVAMLSLGRAAGDLLGPFLFAWGFAACALGAVFFNLLALAALSKIKVGQGVRTSD